MTSPVQFRRQTQDQLADYVRGLVWSADGHTLAAISAVGEVVLWRNADEADRQRIELQGVCNRTCDCVGFSANDHFLAVGGEGGLMQVWDLHEESPTLVFKESFASTWVEHLAWHPVEEWVAIAVNRTVQIWDIQHSKLRAELEFESSSVLDLAWHPTGQFLAVGGHGGVKVWDVQKPEMPLLLFEVPGASLTCRWSVDGQYLASGNLDRTLSILAWDRPPPWFMQGFPGKVSQVAWVTGGTSLIAAACMDGITVWRRDGGNWSSHVLTEHEGFVKAIAFQPQAPLLASGGEDHRVLLWKHAKQVIQVLKGISSGVSCLAWHPLGLYLVGSGMDGQLVIWGQDTPSKGCG